MKRRKIRILYTIPNFDTAGSGRVLYDLAKSLDPDRFEVSIACKHNRGSFFKTVEALGLPIYIMDTTIALRPYWNFFFRLGPLIRFIKTHPVDIVHSWGWSSDWSEVLAARLAGSKFVYTKKAMSWGNLHWTIRSYLSHFIITVNEDMSAFFPNKTHQQLIPFGLDTEYYKSDVDPKSLEASVFKMITVAHLVPVKGIETQLQALHQLNNPRIHLDIIGDDQTPYASDLKQMTSDLQLDQQVSFLGKQSDVRPFFAKAQLYCISSKMEGMPMALVEAMCMGIPVLGSNVPGVRFVLKDFPDLLFEPGDATALAHKIEALYLKTPEAREGLAKQLRDYCGTHFSLNTFINAHETLYLDLAGPQ
ncbi:glycosyltransferase [Flavobacteriaceae bacterium LMO-SS05]